MYTEEFKQTGGARYGNLKASWPFANIVVNKNELSLGISLYNLHFRPTDVLSIEPNSSGFLSGGILIRHTVAGYKNPVVFRPQGDLLQTILQIRQTGFMDNKLPIPAEDDARITCLQAQGAFSIKLPAAIIIVVIWNALLLPNFYRVLVLNQKQFFRTGPQWASAFMVIVFLALIISGGFRNLVLKEGHSFDGMKRFVYFGLAIFSIMLLAFSAFPKVV